MSFSQAYLRREDERHLVMMYFTGCAELRRSSAGAVQGMCRLRVSGAERCQGQCILYSTIYSAVSTNFTQL